MQCIPHPPLMHPGRGRSKPVGIARTTPSSKTPPKAHARKRSNRGKSAHITWKHPAHPRFPMWDGGSGGQPPCSRIAARPSGPLYLPTHDVFGGARTGAQKDALEAHLSSNPPHTASLLPTTRGNPAARPPQGTWARTVATQPAHPQHPHTHTERMQSRHRVSRGEASHAPARPCKRAREGPARVHFFLFSRSFPPVVRRVGRTILVVV